MYMQKKKKIGTRRSDSSTHQKGVCLLIHQKRDSRSVDKTIYRMDISSTTQLIPLITMW